MYKRGTIGGFAAYTVCAYLAALLVSATTLLAVKSIFGVLGIDLPSERASLTDHSVISILFSAAITPIIESMLLAYAAESLISIKLKDWHVCSAIAIAAGLLHASVAWIWFFGVFGSFYIFSHCYLMWRQHCKFCGLAASALPHALLNLTACILS